MCSVGPFGNLILRLRKVSARLAQGWRKVGARSGQKARFVGEVSNCRLFVKVTQRKNGSINYLFGAVSGIVETSHIEGVTLNPARSQRIRTRLVRKIRTTRKG